MNIYEKSVGNLPEKLRSNTIVAENMEQLNKLIASEFCDLLEEKQGRNEMLAVICPVGPLDYGFFASEIRKNHLTFMRNWHAGLWRKAIFGPVTSSFPGSLLQEHPNLKMTLTELAVKPPMLNTAQATGEERQQ